MKKNTQDSVMATVKKDTPGKKYSSTSKYTAMMTAMDISMGTILSRRLSPLYFNAAPTRSHISRTKLITKDV